MPTNKGDISMKKLCTFLLLLLIPVSFSCSQGGPPDNSPVIAKVNKDAVTEADFLRESSRIPEWARSQFETDEGKSKFLDELVKKELIYQHAKKMRLDKNEEYLQKVREFEKLTLVALTLKKEVDDKVKVSEGEVRAFYDENKDKFTVGTQIKASHILVKTKEEAEKARERIMNGEKFETVAKEVSIDKGSAEKGGDLGYFGRGRMVPEFERAALSLKRGEISAPVKTRFGYHIIKQTDVKMGDPASFEQSKEAIRRELINQKRKKYFDQLVDKLKAESQISTDKEVLAAIVLPWNKGESSQEQTKQQQPAEQAETKE
jgi:peptidyl-prolyl cis-trans isomerase C